MAPELCTKAIKITPYAYDWIKNVQHIVQQETGIYRTYDDIIRLLIRYYENPVDQSETMPQQSSVLSASNRTVLDVLGKH